MPKVEGGLTDALTQFLERERPVIEEVEKFEREFAEYLQKPKQPHAVSTADAMPKLTTRKINDLRARFVEFVVLGLKGARYHLMPLACFNKDKGKLEMKVIAYDGASKERQPDVHDSLSVIAEMAEFMNADNTRQNEYGRIYELLRESVAYVENDVSAHRKADYDSDIDLRKVMQTLDHVPFMGSESLINYCYGAIYEKPQMAEIFRRLNVPVSRENFRKWAENDPKFSQKFKDSTQRKITEYVAEFEKKFKDSLRERLKIMPVPQEKPAVITEALKSTVEAAREAIIFVPPVPRPAERREPPVIAPAPPVPRAPAFSRPATAIPVTPIGGTPSFRIPLPARGRKPAPAPVPAAAAPAIAVSLPLPPNPADIPSPQNSIKPTLIIGVGTSTNTQAKAPPVSNENSAFTGDGEVIQFASYIGKIKEAGVVFSGEHIDKICELIFGDSHEWICGEAFDLTVVKKIGLRDIFPPHDHGYYQFEEFAVRLYRWRLEMDGKNIRTAGVRKKFIDALRKFI